jgi:hypothetical protein
MEYTADQIWDRHDRNLAWAIRTLQKMPAFCGTAPKIQGLRGWVFEQVVQSCLSAELKILRLTPDIGEQAKTSGRSRADLQIGHALVEIKLSGCYSRDSFEKYRLSVERAKAARKTYLYFSGEEKYLPNRELAKDIFGSRNTFYLDGDRDWRSFVRRVAACCE